MAGGSCVLRRLYLSVYNWTVFIGWFQVLYLVIKTLNESGHRQVYNAVERPFLLAQSAAGLEIVHSLVVHFFFSGFCEGLVRSPLTATLPQISSRLFVVWGILWSYPETHSYVLLIPMVVSWCITEIIRYSFFGTKEALGFEPSWLRWLRYSTFVVLYPTGILCEIGLICIALPHIKNSEKFCLRMPNTWNFSFDYFYVTIIALVTYVPGSPYLYQYMLGQRKKVLAKLKGE